ncbi:MAG: hypothetical protein ABEI74_00330 [Candidatus Pacearchaeota archaeon]
MKIHKMQSRKYNFWFEEPEENNVDKQNDAATLGIIKDNKDYYGNFVTKSYVNYLFNKNESTGENQSGSYLADPGNMIIVKDLKDETINKTLKDLSDKLILEDFFHRGSY